LTRFARRLLLVTFLVATRVCVAMSYSAESIEGWVVDSKTGKPIEDVAVIAHWVLHGQMEGRIVGQLTILEAVTDATGRYFLPASGPKLVLDPFTVMWNDDPELHYFKSGFELKTLSNREAVSSEYARNPYRTSQWNHQKVALEDMRSDLPRYAGQFSYGGSTTIRMMVESGQGCEWKEMPIFIARLVRERERLEAMGYRPRLPRPTHFSNQANCGSADVWLRSLRQ
jgi:hypothetical protein